jgi:hypothetical protein
MLYGVNIALFLMRLFFAIIFLPVIHMLMVFFLSKLMDIFFYIDRIE